MNIERGPRKPRGFTILDNALVQNGRLSFGARGLAEYLLSLPPGAQVDIRSLAASNPEGRTAIAGYMNELEEARYLVRTRNRGERGRFVTTSTIYEDPQHPASLPASLPKPWSKKKAEGKFSQVGPNPASPDFGGPDFGQPGPGEPDVGDAGVNPVKDVGERTTPSTPPEPEPEAPSDEGGNKEGGGGGDAPQNTELQTAAAAFVDRLPFGARLPGPRQRRHLIERASAAFLAGWTEWDLKAQLTSETASAKSLAAVYRHRLDPDNLPEAPAFPAPRRAEQAGTPPLKAKCPECHRPLRDSAVDALCRKCREELAA